MSSGLMYAKTALEMITVLCYAVSIMKHVLKDIVSFFKGHWPHGVIAVPAAVAFTALHELAHCAAVWAQGGTVTDFAWLPSGTEWGHMNYIFPPGVEYCTTAVSLSPYAFWMGFCLLAGVLALRKAAWRFWIASIIYVWLFIVPLADIANTAVPYLLRNKTNDLQHAFGPARPAYAVMAIGFAIAAAIGGFWLNKRLYRDRAVGVGAYGILTAAAALALLAVSV